MRPRHSGSEVGALDNIASARASTLKYIYIYRERCMYCGNDLVLVPLLVFSLRWPSAPLDGRSSAGSVVSAGIMTIRIAYLVSIWAWCRADVKQLSASAALVKVAVASMSVGNVGRVISARPGRIALVTRMAGFEIGLRNQRPRCQHIDTSTHMRIS